MAKDNEINSLKTLEQRFKELKWDKMFVSRKMITSKAFLSLKTATACQVFMIFLNKCQWKPIEGSSKRSKEYYLANEGEIQFTYREGWKKWGINSNKFTRAIDELIRVGLIDIAKTGFGLYKDVTLYSTSNRWENFGTDEFVVKKRAKRKQQFGFTNKNKYGRNCKRQK